MPGELSKAAAIVGAAEAKEIGYPEEMKTAIQLHIEAIKNVSDQTGIPISMIDGVFGAGWSSQIAEHLGIHPGYIDTTAVGGCSFEMHVHHALAAIHAGIVERGAGDAWRERLEPARDEGPRHRPRPGGSDPWSPDALMDIAVRHRRARLRTTRTR